MVDKFDDKDKFNSNSEELNNFEAEDNPAKDFLYFLFDLIKTGLVVFIIAFSLRYFAVQPFVVDGESMMPNFVNNEYILAEKVSYLTGEPKRGDVVVFRYPGNPSISYIKRIIGLPGETVTIANNSVKITSKDYQNGTTLNESYIPKTTLTLIPDTDSGTLQKTLGNDEYFVLGDNRQHSSDSREWGVLPRANIIGRTWLTILPTDKFGIQKRVEYSYSSLSRSFSFLVSPHR
ncbi:MAG: signal peptidase I [Patescibacteria group bacterium]|nr:signal peptidase I [Patescibacteria group bacterium]